MNENPSPTTADDASPDPPAAADDGSPDPRAAADDESSRLDLIEARLERMETVLEGLQDAVHRRSLFDDGRIDELQRRLRPERLARDLSDDARSRGI